MPDGWLQSIFIIRSLISCIVVEHVLIVVCSSGTLVSQFALNFSDSLPPMVEKCLFMVSAISVLLSSFPSSAHRMFFVFFLHLVVEFLCFPRIYVSFDPIAGPV